MTRHMVRGEVLDSDVFPAGPHTMILHCSAVDVLPSELQVELDAAGMRPTRRQCGMHLVDPVPNYVPAA